MKNLKDYLSNINVSDDLKTVVFVLADCIQEIANVIAVDKGHKAGSENAFGEEQVAMDIAADRIVFQKLKESGVVGLIASEELHQEEKIGDGNLAVAHDPLDGSSLVDVNLTVGSIFGIYHADTFIGKTGEDQLGAMVGMYGPRTSFFLTLREGVAYFILEGDQFILQKEIIEIAEEGKMFAPGNLRACSESEQYFKLLEYWIQNQYTLRYSGGMVPDIGQILIKGKGVFTYPGTQKDPSGKLRLLFECAPMALIMEQAKGVATDGKQRILEKKIDDLFSRTPIYIGSKEEVKLVEKYLEG